MVLPLRRCLLFFPAGDTDFARRCGFFPHSPLLSFPLLSSPLMHACVLCCVGTSIVCMCVRETRRGQTVALRISFKQTSSCQASPQLSEGSVKQNIAPLLYNHMSCFLGVCHVQPFSVNYSSCVVLSVLAVGMCTRQEL